MAEMHTHRSGSVRAAVITVSDRSATGERPDTSGPRAVSILSAAGFDINGASIVPDGAESVRDSIQNAMDLGARVVITTGGTGVGPRDLTPEGTRMLLVRELPGIAEALRREGQKQSPMAVLSRGVVGIAGDPTGVLVANLPGSERAVAQGLDVLLPLVPHILDQLDGGDH